MPDLRKLIKYEETLAANAKEDDPISILYKRNTVSSRAKLGDKAKEKEQQVLQTLGEKSSSKQNMEAGDQASGKLTSQPDSVFTKSSRKESVTDFATAFCNQLCLDDEKSRGDGDKPRPQYKLGMQREVSSDESCPSSQRSKWSSRSSFPRCRPLSAAKGKIRKRKTYFIIIPNCFIYFS